MTGAFLEELQTLLRQRLTKFSVVLMSDFFLDRLVSLDWNAHAFSGKLESVEKRKGGSLDDIRQTDLRGGNAINTSSALVALGAKVVPIVCTNRLGAELLKFHLKSRRADVSHVKILDDASVTTALELRTSSGKVNVMLRDLGGLAEFGPQNLDERDFQVIESADYVCVFNWAGTRRFGTALAKEVFRRVKTKGVGRTYYDTADPTPNEKKIPQLVKGVLQNRNLDVLSVNENEAVCYAGHLSDEVEELQRKLTLEEVAMAAARILASHLQARIDLHTTSFSATLAGGKETVVPAFDVPMLRATGAGDAWNAGNILGDACNASDTCRLALANAAAAYYISSPGGEHASREQLVRFCERLRVKKMAG